MSLDLCILASGSAGNCSVLRTPAGALLIDAGIGPRLTATRLKGTGIALADLRAICLTHLDRDHFNPNWIPTLLRFNIPLFCHANHLGAWASELGERHLRPFDGDPFEPFPGVTCHPIHLAHDAEGSHGFTITGHGHRIGYATDLGHVPPRWIDHLCHARLDLLAIESNYDPQMQRNSGRPWFLQQRITGGRGHLSNSQAFAAIQTVLDRCQAARRPLPAHVVLLHRSRQCNCPNLLRTLFAADTRLTGRLTLAEQYERTPWLRPQPGPYVGEQLALSWG